MSRPTALDLDLALGPIVPVYGPRPDGGCACGKADCPSPCKHPMTQHGWHDGSSDPAVIGEWWRRWPGANIGRLTTELVLVDIDNPTALEALLALGVDLALAPRVRTGRGLHAYYRKPAHLQEGRFKLGNLPPGVDVFVGHVGFVVAPGSIHRTGVPYEWIDDVPSRLDDLPPPPPELLVLLPIGGQGVSWDGAPAASTVRDPGPSTNGAHPVAPERGGAPAWATGFAELWSGVPEGQRHDGVGRAAGILCDRGFHEVETLALLRTWNRANRPPISDAELAGYVRYVYAKDPGRAYDPGAALVPVPGMLGETWNTIDVRTLLSSTPPSQRWLLRHPTRDWRPCPPGQGDGMLERGVVGVLSASGGSGKSMLLLQMAVSLLTGRPWVGFAGPAFDDRGRVCYLAGEDRRESLHRRLLAVVDGLALDDDEREVVADRLRIVSLARRPFRLFEVDSQERLCPGRGYEDLRRHLGEDGDGRWSVVILDPAARLCGATIELDNDQATACVQHLEQLSDDAGDAAILMAVHVSKATKLAGQSHARGVSGLGDAARWHLGLVQDRLEFHKANDAVPWQDRPVYLSRQGRLFTRADGPPVHENPEDIDAVVEVARRLGAQTSRDVLWQNAGLSQGPGRAAVRDALRRGDLEVTSRPTGKIRSGNPVVHATNGCRCAECAECVRRREEAADAREPLPF